MTPGIEAAIASLELHPNDGDVQARFVGVEVPAAQANRRQTAGKPQQAAPPNGHLAASNRGSPSLPSFRPTRANPANPTKPTNPTNPQSAICFVKKVADR